MTLPIAMSPRPSVPSSIALSCMAMLVGSCQTPGNSYRPGPLDGDRMARCKAAAEAYVDSDPDYPALRDELKKDPVAMKWFVRYLEAHVVEWREGRAELISKETVRLDKVDTKSKDPVRWDLPGQRGDSRAIQQIVAIGEPAVEVVINDLVVSPQEFLRTIGIEILTGIGDPAVPALLELARSGGLRQQRVAARALGKLGARGKSLAALRELSRSSEWRVRSDAAQGLAQGGAGARDLLFDLLSDEDQFVRRKAAESLGNYQDPVVGGRLVDFLERCKSDGDWNGELAAQKALQMIAGTRGPRSAGAWRNFVDNMPPAAGPQESRDG